MSTKRKCFYCSRGIFSNHITGLLRWHKPGTAGLKELRDNGMFWMTSKDACPGVGSKGSEL